jgi:hypothetical protein
MESPCSTCEFRKRSKSICMSIKTYCKKLLEHQSRITILPSQSQDFSGEYSTPGRHQIKKGVSYDFD